MAREIQPKPSSDLAKEEWLPDGEVERTAEAGDTRIYKSSGINPGKRRRLEMMQEERELQKALREVFDED